MVFAFAGTINSPDYFRLLGKLAECLERHGGRLLIFGPLTADQAAKAGLAKTNIQLGGLVKPDVLLQRLRKEADVLFVPMSFSLSDRPNMEIAFPSKLTEYTAAGLPILNMRAQVTVRRCAGRKETTARRRLQQMMAGTGGIGRSAGGRSRTSTAVGCRGGRGRRRLFFTSCGRDNLSQRFAKAFAN